MTTIGHSMTGLSIALLIVPRELPVKQSLLVGGLYATLANAPDIPFPGWGHNEYAISHSFIVAIAIALTAGLLVARWKPRSEHAPRILAGATIAWLSHMVLDATYSHGNGLEVLWPISDTRLALPIQWFNTLSLPPMSDANRRVFLTEISAFGSLLILTAVVRLTWSTVVQRRSRG